MRKPSVMSAWRVAETSAAVRADAVVSELARRGVPAKVVKTESAVGGGSLPEETQPSRAVALDLPAASRAAAVLRAADPPVVARIVDDLVALDLRSVLPEDDGRLAAAVSRALAGQGRTE